MRRTSADIRTANRYEVLRRLIAGSPCSRQRLAAETGLSLATVATLVGELLELGLAVEVGHEDSAGGRPRGLVAVDAAGGLLVGVDVAETYVHAELFDLGLGLLAQAEEPLRPGRQRPEHLVEHIRTAVLAVLANRPHRDGPHDDRPALDGAPADEAHRPRVRGVGVSMPGQIDRARGTVVYAANWDWRDVPLAALLTERLAHPVHLDSPLRACTVAELWFGAARGREDAVVVNLGTGVGAGLALGGTVHRGITNSAGEWGHTKLVLDGRPCHCGGRGCVEAYVGAPAIRQTLRELAPDSPLLHPGDQTATIDALARGLAEGQPTAVRVVRETARHLGAAVADLVNLLNPEVVVLSSWVAAKLGEPLLAEVRRSAALHALDSPFSAVEIMLSPIPSDPVSLGAATFVLEAELAAAGGGSRSSARFPGAEPVHA